VGSCDGRLGRRRARVSVEVQVVPELVVQFDSSGRQVRSFVAPDGTVGEMTGSASELGHALGVHPHTLMQAIHSGAVPATFVGQGRYRVGGDVMARGVDSSGRLRPD